MRTNMEEISLQRIENLKTPKQNNKIPKKLRIFQHRNRLLIKKLQLNVKLIQQHQIKLKNDLTHHKKYFSIKNKISLIRNLSFRIQVAQLNLDHRCKSIIQVNEQKCDDNNNNNRIHLLKNKLNFFFLSFCKIYLFTLFDICSIVFLSDFHSAKHHKCTNLPCPVDCA